MRFKNSQKQSMEVAAKIVVTLGTTNWEGHKEMFHILFWVLLTQAST